jgi:hypothetical protein
MKVVGSLTTNQGVVTGAKAAYVPVFFGDEHEDSLTVVPGPPGVAGAPGGAGGQGLPGVALLLEGPPGEDGFPLPGPPGPAGVGIQGVQGIQGVPGPVVWLDGEQGEEGFPTPGPPGVAGVAGGTGATGGQGVQGLPGVSFAPPADGWDDAPCPVLAAAFRTVRTAVGSEITAGGPADTLTVNSPNATVLLTPNNATKTLSVDLADNVIVLTDSKGSGTAGGTFTSGAWRTRDLQTEQHDGPGACTLPGSNQFTLLAGTYEADIRAPAFYVNSHQAILYNVTDAGTTLNGTSEYSGVGTAYSVTPSVIRGVFTIAASKTFEVRHQCTSTNTTFGFGQPAGFTTEVYTVVTLRKIA